MRVPTRLVFPSFAKTALMVAGIVGLSSPATAGWFEVTAFEGSIGKYPVHLALQSFKQLDGPKSEWEGSYYYDAHRIPIRIHGNADAQGALNLCETIDERNNRWLTQPGQKSAKVPDQCPIHLTPAGEGYTGTWGSGEKSLPIALHRVGSLDNTDREHPQLTGKVELPQWVHSKKHMALAVYEKASCDGVEVISMRSAKVVNIASGSVVYTVKPSEDCDAGIVMTAIFMNASIHAGPRRDFLSVSIGEGKYDDLKDFGIKDGR